MERDFSNPGTTVAAEGMLEHLTYKLIHVLAFVLCALQ